MLKWNMFAGGTFAAEGKHGFQATFAKGKYDISPVSSPSGRHRGYQTYFLNEKGALPGGLWQNIGLFSSPNGAKGACKSHYLKHFGGK